MGTLIIIGQLLLSLSILVVLHELGHFAPARWFGIRVEKFYLFFNPWFELFKKKIGETEYGIGWLPLGGYVKIAGMVDESLDRAQLEQPVQAWEFRAKPAWQRLIVMVGGVTVNFILGFLIFSMVLFVWGDSYIPNNQIKNGVYADPFAQEMGFQTGDQVLEINGQPVERFRNIQRDIFLKEAKTATVLRQDKQIVLDIPEELTGKLASYKGIFLMPRIPFVIGEVPSNSHNISSGLQKNDKLLAINGVNYQFFDEVQGVLSVNKSKGIQATILRSDKDTLNISLAVSAEGKIGVYPLPYQAFFESKQVKYSLLESIPAGFQRANQTLSDYVSSLGQIFSRKVDPNQSLGGFASIGKMFGTDWIWERFWTMTAVLSIILAFMNLLPIPALDGGHVLFLLFEMITGRKPSDKFLEYATVVGFVIVLSLVVYANGLDILRGIGFIK